MREILKAELQLCILAVMGGGYDVRCKRKEGKC